jgi:hypothetical protein
MSDHRARLLAPGGLVIGAILGRLAHLCRPRHCVGSFGVLMESR